VNTLTRSECPRLARSWILSASTSSMTVARSCARSASPDARAASSRSRSSRGVPVRRATANRAGALSGKSNDTFRSAASGSSRRAARSNTTRVKSDPIAATLIHKAAVHGLCARGNARLNQSATPNEKAMGTAKISSRSPQLRSGRRRHSPSVTAGKGCLLGSATPLLCEPLKLTRCDDRLRQRTPDGHDEGVTILLPEASIRQNDVAVGSREFDSVSGAPNQCAIASRWRRQRTPASADRPCRSRAARAAPPRA
jgi:hypothetical protein